MYYWHNEILNEQNMLLLLTNDNNGARHKVKYMFFKRQLPTIFNHIPLTPPIFTFPLLSFYSLQMAADLP